MNNTQATTNNTAPQKNHHPHNTKRKRPFSIIKFIALSILALLILLMLSVIFLRYNYNDQHIKEIITQRFNAESKDVLSIGEFKSSLLDQTVEIKDIAISSKLEPQKKILTLQNLELKIDIFKSISERTIHTEVTLNQLLLNIKRIKIIDKESNKVSYSTNITDMLNKLIDLPWKKWLSNIDWQSAGGFIKINQSEVAISDELGLLESCSLSAINISLTRINEDISFYLSLLTKTVGSKGGSVDMNIEATLNKPKDYNRESKLVFLNHIKIDSNLNDIDVAEYLEYFDVHRIKADDVSITLKDPVSISIKADSTTMTDVIVESRVSSKSIGVIAAQDMLVNITPELEIRAVGQLDFSKIWTEIKTFKVLLRLFNKTGDMINASTMVNGNFGNQITATASVMTDLSIFSNSELGKKLGSNFKGKINHAFAGNWKRDGVWKGKYTVSGDNVTTLVKGKAVKLPINGDIDCLITKSKVLIPLAGSFKFDFNLPYLSFSSTEPLDIDFTAKDRFFSTSIKYHADLEKLYESFQPLFDSLNIAIVSEEIAGTLDANNKGDIVCHFTSTSKLDEFQSSPISVTGSLSPSAEHTYEMTLKATDMKDLHFTVKGLIARQNKLWSAKLAQSGEYELKVISVIARRFKHFFGKALADSAFSGKLQESINADFKMTAPGKFSLAMGLHALGSNITATRNNKTVHRQSLDLATAFILKKRDLDIVLNIDQLKLTTPESSIELTTEDYSLTPLQNAEWEEALKSIPEMKAKLIISTADMDIIGKLLPNAIAELFFSQAKLSGSLYSKGKGEITVNNLNYSALPMSVKAHKDFVINPMIMAAKIKNDDWFSIQESLTELDLTLSANLASWKSFIPSIAANSIEAFTFDALYYPKTDRLSVKKFATTANTRKDVLIPQLVFSGAVNNFFKNIKSFKLNDFLLSIDKTLNITAAEISVPQLKLLDDQAPGANVRALRDEFIKIEQLNINHKPESPRLEVTCTVETHLSYLSKSSQIPLLTIEGIIATASTPFILNLTTDLAKIKGSIDLSKANIAFNALTPYVYSKPANTPLKLDFDASLNDNGEAKVASAALIGGPLAVNLSGFALKPEHQRFILKLDKISMDGPISANINNLLLDSVNNRLKAEINIAPLDLSSLQQSLNLPLPVNISGSVSSSSLTLDDSYWKYFAIPGTSPVQSSYSPNNSASIGSTNVTFTGTSSGNSVSMSFSGGSVNSSLSSLLINGFSVDNPQGFSTNKAVEAESISISPDLSTLFSDQITINTIDVQNLKAYYEVALMQNNFDVLQNNISQIFSSGGGGGGNSGGGRNLLISNLNIAGVVKLSSALTFGVAAIPIPLNLHLTNVGGGDAGSTFAAGFGSLFTSVAKVGVGLVGTVGGVVEKVENVGKSIITAPFKLFGKDNKKNQNEGQ